MHLFDSHTHTDNSHDGKSNVNDICKCAMKYGLKGISITDHCDINKAVRSNFMERISKSVNDASWAKEGYKNILKVSRGIEWGQPLYNMEYAVEVINMFDLDFVLGSVHRIRKYDVSFLDVDFKYFTNDELILHLREYLEEVFYTIEFGQFDVLAHLTLLLRYINGRYKRSVLLDSQMDIITEILSLLVHKNIGLELNVSGIGTAWNEYMPNRSILETYYRLGGTIVTVGSDSHTAASVGSNIKDGIELLKGIGFKYYAFYENRNPTMVKIV